MLERRLGAWESGFRAAHDMLDGTMLVVTCAKIQAVFSIETIKNTLRLLFQKHPLLRSTINTRGYNTYFVVNAEFDQIPITVVDIEKNWQDQFEVEIHTALHTDKYLWRISLLPIEDGFYILFSHHHAMADAISAANFIEEFMNLYNELLEAKQVSISSLPLLKNVETYLPVQQTWDQFEKHYLALDAHVVDEIEYANNATLNQRLSKNIFIKLPQNELNILLTQCKLHNVTLNSLLNAVVLQTQFQEHPELKNASLKTPVDLRPYCKPRIDRQNMGCYISIVETWHQNTKQGVWESASNYQTELHQAIPTLGFLPKKTDYAELDMALATKLFGVENTRRRKFLPNTLPVYNLGRLAMTTEFSKVKLKDFVFSTNHKVGNYYMFISVLTLADELRLILTYVDPLMDKKTATQFIERFLENLKVVILN